MKAPQTLKIALAVGLLVGATVLWWPSGDDLGGRPIRIAFAGPVSGPSAEDGLSAVRAIQLVIDQVNRAGGIAGRPLALTAYDDVNDASRARTNAATIADERETIAVIGHNYSTCSIAAGEVYAERGLPAISTAATSVDVTARNPWYFRVVYNDRVQGRLIALYVAEVLGAKHIGIINESAQYGAFLAEVMAAAAAQVGIARSERWDFDPSDPDLGRRLDAIVAAASGPGGPDPLILAMQPEAGVALVQRLVDRGFPGRIVVSDTLASQAFLDGFDGLPAERARRGHYTNGIYASTPLLFDSAGRRAGAFYRAYVARHDRAPDWYAAYAADAATVIIEALRRAEISPTAETIDADREALRDALAAIGPDDPVPGVTGPTWFDAVGDAVKPVPMGRLRNGEIVSAVTQLQLATDATVEGLEPDRVIRFGDQVLHVVEVARVGIIVRRFKALDFEYGTFDLDFDLWFRHSGDDSVEDVVFTNAVEPIELGAPIDESDEGDSRYRLYRSSGSFRADTLDTAYGEHSLAISLRNRIRTRDDLIYAADSIGLNLGRERSRKARSARARRLLGPSSPWTVDDVILFEEEHDEHARGHPDFLDRADAVRRFSQFTIGLTVRPANMSLTRSIPARQRRPLLAIGLLGSVLLLFVGRGSPRLRWLLQSVFALLVLASAEPVVGAWVRDLTGSYHVAAVSRLFAVLWWAVPAVLISSAFDHLVWREVERAGRHPVPTILRYFVSFLIYMLAFFGVVAFVYDYKLTGLLATSGVLAMIIGLAVQLNITNIFAGVALNLERPFRVGDWIMIHGRTPGVEDGVIGMVVDINWRTTRLRTADDTEIVIPNGLISEKTITNFMSPGEVSRFELFFTVDQAVPPERVIEVIRAALESVVGSENNGPMRDPKPSVRIHHTSEHGIEYMVRYRLIPREVSPAKARHTINEGVLRALREAGIALAYPRRIYSGENPVIGKGESA